MMSPYGALARWYDCFTRDVPYAALAGYYAGLLRRDGLEHMTLLDLCCGTGSLTLPLAEMGHELIGVDAAPEMLSLAAQKAQAATLATPPLFLCQQAAELDLYGTVQGALCGLDGLNYLPPEQLPELFHRLHLFLEPGAYFAFDVHSPDHLRELDGGVFVDETEDALCLWRGEFDPEENALCYGMDLFSREGAHWRRDTEEHIEYIHTPQALTQALQAAGFTDVEQTVGAPMGDGRLFFRARNQRIPPSTASTPGRGKKRASLLLALLLLLTGAGCGRNRGETEEEPGIIQIGVFEPLNGPDSASGKREALGIQYANQETPYITLGGKDYQIQLVLADNGSDTDMARTAATWLVEGGVSLVLGSYGDTVSMAGAPIFGQAGIAAVGISCTDPAVTGGNDYYFRICWDNSLQGTVMADFALGRFGALTAYCLGESGNQVQSERIAAFRQRFEAAGGRVLTDLFPSGCTEFGPYLSRAEAMGAEVIFTPVEAGYGVYLLTQAAALDSAPVILGTDAMDDGMVPAAVEGTDLRLYITAFYQEGGSPAFDAGIRDYIAQTPAAAEANGGSGSISALSAMGYDAYYLALEAMQEADSPDHADILAILPAVTSNGITGSITFDSSGNAVRDAAYLKRADTQQAVWTLDSVRSVAEER